MNIEFNLLHAQDYKSKSQIARVLTENWIADQMFCIRCGNSKITKTKNNSPVADFVCPNCNNVFELKSKSGSIGKSVVDGDYESMITKINNNTNPDFLFLAYDNVQYRVNNLIAIPRFFFLPSLIEKRKPLKNTARRAGWVGCNILFQQFPSYGKISIIESGLWHGKQEVISSFNRASFLEKQSIQHKSWIIDIMSCLNKIPNNDFTLDDVYQFEPELKVKHPDNNNIKAKIRQQLQVLRDKGIISFEARGRYKKL